MQAQEEFVMIKGKRSKRPRLASPLAFTSSDLSGGGDVGDGVISDVSPCNSGAAHHTINDQEEEDMANCLILLAKGQRPPPPPPEAYQCKTCSRSFPSFQALGGHRASHKTKPNKPATSSSTSNLEDTKRAWMRESFVDVDGTNLSLQMRSAGPNKSRVHECSICGAEFGSGQALGGHMRRHRPIPAAAQAQAQGVKRARNQLLSLDLNLPAPEDDHLESKFPFAQKEQVIVFAASPLIDCHY